MESLRAHLESTIRSDVVSLLSEYGSIPCLSPAFDRNWVESGHIERALALYQRWIETRQVPGLTSRIQRIEGRTPLLVVDVPGTDDATDQTTVLLYGHLDKQPATDPWSEGLNPFESVLRGEHLFGRGMVDDGYAAPLVITVLEELARQRSSYPHCVLIVEACEESGSPDLDAHLEELLPAVGQVSLVVCLDSGGLDFQRLWVTSSLRGNLVISIKVAVLENGVHSGEAGGVVPSSFRILRSLLSRIEDPETGEILPDFLNVETPGFYRDEAERLSRDLGDPLAGLFPLLGTTQLMGMDGADRLLNQTWRPSLSFIGIDGVPPVPDGGNVLRPFTTGKISLRLPPTINAIAAQEQLVSLLSTEVPYGAHVEIEAESPAQGWVAKEPSPWLASALEEGSKEGFGKPAAFCGEGGSIPFMATLGERFPNADFVATGALGPGSNAHGPDESLYLPAAVGVATALAVVLGAAPR
ncbi:M20/M25/M40 family metallo-hydrolase [Ferrimicrobium sp.]|uniref:M20/M25/M40 family metallo-hydrolase n=1 Tax=Ferrimicrobium sp. TaxID=2926050 RepID=UPI00261A020A|nr:M20/M25/M40 family metallo-hydrolase [Ferrimicrobium sp.]